MQVPGSLRSDHWLSDSRNIIQLHLSQKAFGPVGDQPAAAPSPRSQMETWSVKQLIPFLKGAGLEGPGAAFYKNVVAGADFLAILMETLTNGLGLSAFAARKLLAARSAFLEVVDVL